MRGAFVVCVSSFVLISCSSLPLPSSSSEFEGQSTSSSPFGQFEVPSHFWTSHMNTEVFPHRNLSSPRHWSSVIGFFSSLSTFSPLSSSTSLSAESLSGDLTSGIVVSTIVLSSVPIGPSSSRICPGVVVSWICSVVSSSTSTLSKSSSLLVLLVGAFSLYSFSVPN